MVNRERDLSKVVLGNTTYFVVPDPLADDFADFIKNRPGFEPTGENGSHVKWDYTEWAAPARIADEGIEFLWQMLLIMNGGEQD